MDKHYDLVVLGGGPGGYTAAFRAADLGLSVCLVEKRASLGGVCLNEGCIPSKTLLHGTSLLEELTQAKNFGVHVETATIDPGCLRQKKDEIVNRLTTGLDSLCKARKITRLQGLGRFTDTSHLQVSANGRDRNICFTDTVIATGSSPFMLPDIPDDPRIWDSTAALELATVPERLLIIGGGVIGLEMAQVYHALGSRITIVELLPQIIAPADKDLISPLLRKIKKQYQILTRTKLVSLKAEKNCIMAQFSGPKAVEDPAFDAVLIAIGRRPNTAGIGLSSLGIDLDTRGFIPVNKQLQSSVPHIYGIGDVAGEPMLAHKATREGKVAAETIAGSKTAFRPKTIPSVAYTSPEVAWAGLTEKEAKAQQISYRKGKFPWGASGRALSTGVDTGFTKVLFDSKNGRIIGAGICGAHAGELIHEAVLAIEMELTAHQISKTVHAHPTLAETFAFAAEIVDGSITDGLPPKNSTRSRND